MGRVLLGILGLLWSNWLFAQVHAGAFLSEGSGKAISSIMAFSAYPAQRIPRTEVGVFGGKQFQTTLNRVGIISAIKVGTHSLVAGGDRLGSDVMHHDNIWAAYALPVSKTSTIGLRTGIHFWKARGYNTHYDISIGVGWSSDISDQIHWRVQVDGIEKFWNPNYRTTYLGRSLIYYKVSDRAGLSLEAVLDDGQSTIVIPALHYSFDDKIYCRMSAMSKLNAISFSLGYIEKGWGFETNLNMHNRLGMDGFIVVHYKL